MFIETGATGRNPFRKMFTNRQDTILDFNKYKAFTNVYHSSYWFREQEEKFDKSGNFRRWGPDYNTAIIDKIDLDLDSYKTIRHNGDVIEVYTDDGLLAIRKFARWCKEHNYMRRYIFSGGGFRAILKSTGHPLKLRDGMLNIGRDLEIEIDPATVGDTSRMTRVINSFNFGEHRKCYCIPLSEEELNLDYHKIRKIAEEPRFRENFIYGEEPFFLNSFKIDEDKIRKKQLFISLKEDSDADEILAKYGWKTDEFCDPIKHIISMDYVGHYLRWEVIKYLKSVVRMDFEDLLNCLVALLKEAGLHSVCEGQTQHAFIKNRVFSPKKLKAMDFCPPNCYKCKRIINVI